MGRNREKKKEIRMFMFKNIVCSILIDNVYVNNII